MRRSGDSNASADVPGAVGRRRSVALVGSIAIHVALGALLVAMRASAPASDPAPRTAALEIVEADHAMLVDVVELVQQVNGGGGGSPGVRADVANRAGTANADSTMRHDRDPAIVRVAHANPRRETAFRRDPSMEKRAPRDRAVSDALGEMAIESRDTSGDVRAARQRDGRDDERLAAGKDGGDGGGLGVHGDGGDGRGQGGGHGSGRGRGVGDGVGRVVSEQPRVATPAAPKASRARPAKLIYPKRQGDVEAGKLFVARVTVDAEGFVVGASLLQGDGPYRGQAGGLIFRFRYLPALDDDGRPIRSTFEQEFLVQP